VYDDNVSHGLPSVRVHALRLFGAVFNLIRNIVKEFNESHTDFETGCVSFASKRI
jgi:hypothetical protein